MLTISLLGDLQVHSDGQPLTLPPSRKTRALLAYLALSPRPQRRERLCELLWDLPDDPRGALRWSLSKLRALLDRPGASVVNADRQRVALDLAPAQVDLLEARELVGDDVDAVSTADLERAAALFRGPFLADLEAPRHPELQSWLAGLRDEARRRHASILAALDERCAADAHAALPHVRELVRLNPEDEASWTRLVLRLVALGRRREADDQYAAARVALADVGGETRALKRALDGDAPTAGRRPDEPRQEVRFCVARDGTRIAFALSGAGPPLVKAANWLNHLEHDWESPIWDHFLRRLSRSHRLLRHDARGNGLSDWECGELSLDAWVSDLEAVVDAAGYDRFPLLGMSQGCAISIAYAAKHPERVSHLILYAGFPAGVFQRAASEAEREHHRAMATLLRLGWGQPNAAFRQLFTSLFIPDATHEQADAFNELQRRSTAPECAKRCYETVTHLDVRDLLPRVTVPTLVLHPQGDAVIRPELGRQMASSIPGARFVMLPGQNHLMLEHKPATERFFEELGLFLAAFERTPFSHQDASGASADMIRAC